MKRSRILSALFAAYCALMLWLLFDRPGQIEGVPYWEQVGMSVNLIPFVTIRRYIRLLTRMPNHRLIPHAIVNLLGNVVMFIPLGLFLPLLFGKLQKFWKTQLAAALIITLVELAQLFTLVGSCDVDDLLLNLLGTAAGYGIYKCVKRK